MIAVELYRYRALVWALARRDLLARYRGTVLGFGWTLLHPLFYLGAYSLIFGRVVHLSVERYPAFLFSGLLPWTWFSSCLLLASTSILADAPLVKRAAFPASVPPLVVALASLVNFLLALPTLAVVLLAFGVRPTPGMLALPVLVALQFAFSLGLATAIAALTVRFRDVAQIAQAVIPIAFLLTPIAYPGELLERELPQPLGALAIWGNPLAVFARSYQRVLVLGEAPEPLALVLLLIFSFAALVLGSIVLDRLRDRIPEEI
jgi:lipopolysaccharide transport system permease protein